MATEYIVVRGNSTEGAFIVERAERGVLNWTLADHHGVYRSKKLAERVARLCNRADAEGWSWRDLEEEICEIA